MQLTAQVRRVHNEICFAVASWGTHTRKGILSVDDTLTIDDYPQLALQAWNRVIRQISGEEAFALYERNWRFVEPDQLTPEEAILIKRLTTQYGRGVMNV